jgi:hypothetical protein
MKIVLPLVAALAGIIAASQCASAYVFIGSGTASCQAWTAVHQQPRGADAAGQEQWLLGFLSGIGFMALGELDPLHGMAAEAVWGWVDRYCGGHASETLEAAARAYIQEHPR